MTDPDNALPWAQPLLVSDISGKRGVDIKLRPDAEQRLGIARQLGIVSIRKLIFVGTLRPTGKADWLLSVKLGASVTQSCVVTMEPVKTRIDEIILRKYLSALPEFEAGSELEMPADETIEPIGEIIDPVAVLLEALALALPQFPKKPGAELTETIFTKPGKAPMSDADARPFAQLKSLRSEQNDDTD